MAAAQPLSSAELAAAVRLLALLGAERFIRLPELIDEIRDDSGHGEVTIVIYDARIVSIKGEKAWR